MLLYCETQLCKLDISCEENEPFEMFGNNIAATPIHSSLPD